MEKKTLSNVPGFEPGSFDRRSTTLTNRATQAPGISFSTGRRHYIAFRHLIILQFFMVELKYHCLLYQHTVVKLLYVEMQYNEVFLSKK